MANTIKLTENAIHLIAIDADWNWYDTLTAFATDKPAIPIHSIQFKPAATGDHCVIKNGSGTAAVIFDKEAADKYDDKVVYFHGEKLKPFLDVGDGSYNAAARVIITLAEG